MFDNDRSNFIAYLNELPEQVSVSETLMKKKKFKVKTADIHNIVLSGMGGSAISGELLLDYLADELKVPTYLNRNYHLPAFVNEKTLFIAISYSGDTEETLSAMQEAIDRSATVIGISSGGEVESKCRMHDFPHIAIKPGLPPRQALGYLFFPLLIFFEKIGMISSKAADRKETSTVLNDLVERYSPEKNFRHHNMANNISQSIYHAIPVIYSGVPYLGGVTVRWRNQFSENAKSMAFSNVLPELNHNEIMGWEGLHEVNKHFRVIFLRDADEGDRIRQRIEITKKILKKNNILFGEVYAEGESRLAKIFSLISAGDWASYYWAMLNEKDPFKIDSIDQLKQRLGEVNA